MTRALDKPEAILYGRFVTAAYTMFKRDRTLLRPEPEPGDIPAPYELVAWLNMSDFIFWWREIPKFYGFIARHQQQKHNFVLAIRGTEGWVEWLDDAVVRLVPFPEAGRVERGFNKIYSTLKVAKRHAGVGVAPAAKPSVARAAAPPSDVMAGSFAEQLEQLANTLEEPGVQEQMRIAKEKRPRRSFAVTGHSLGAALATLFVMENKEKNKFDISTVCTFASPRVGNAEFVRQFNLLPLDSWRIVNRQDIVPKVPRHIPVLFDYEHVATLSEFSSAGVVKRNPGCWHSMSTYLHWLDPSIGVDAECKR
jgi:hypothetical protein